MTAKKEAAQKEAEKLKFEIQALTSEVSTCKSNEATERQKHVTEVGLGGHCYSTCGFILDILISFSSRQFVVN